MPPRPIHRWKSLWLGLIILLFLTWAWARSRTHADGVIIQLYSLTWTGVESADGYAMWNTITYRPGSPYTGPPGRFHTIAVSRKQAGDWFKPPIKIENRDLQPPQPTFTSHGIALWLITLLYLLTWLSFLAWRWQRIRKASHPQPT
ncbi:hypothetical protein [Luteolibacter soli]|uniref:DUF3592 domain-containing protein n=1 Tax=Luteolibacter soli TaxID=3135280 RepID=A0ABU9AXA8_9BACT